MIKSVLRSYQFSLFTCRYFTNFPIPNTILQSSQQFSPEADFISPSDEFHDIFQNSLESNSFVQLLLTDNKQINSNNEVTKDLKTVHGRLVMLKTGLKFQITRRYMTNDIIKNIDIPDVKKNIDYFLSNGFKRGILTTSNVEYELSLLSKVGKLKKREKKIASEDLNTILAHNRQKKVAIDNNASFFQELGIIAATGKPRAGMTEKYHQIQKFVEILLRLVKSSDFNQSRKLQQSLQAVRRDMEVEPINVVDIGCGMGYLTFAIHSALSQEYDVCTTGIELRQSLVTQTNAIVEKLSPEFQQLQFLCGDITTLSKSYSEMKKEDNNAKNEIVDPVLNEMLKSSDRNQPSTINSVMKSESHLIDLKSIDILVALHACDTATDEAIWYGIKNNARVIVTAPCCHKELRPQINSHQLQVEKTSKTTSNNIVQDHPLRDILKYGIYRERHTEIVTDSLRALLLEIAGYEVNVFEFVGGEHTAKNVMITAVKKDNITPDSSDEDDMLMHNKQRQKKRSKLGMDGSIAALEDGNEETVNSSIIVTDVPPADDEPVSYSTQSHIECLWKRFDNLCNTFGIQDQRLACLMGYEKISSSKSTKDIDSKKVAVESTTMPITRIRKNLKR